MVTIMTAEAWTVAEAKARLSELLERVREQGPQTITRRGRVAAVVVSPEEWARKSQRVGSLAEFLVNSPLRESGIVIERARDGPRPVDL